MYVGLIWKRGIHVHSRLEGSKLGGLPNQSIHELTEYIPALTDQKNTGIYLYPFYVPSL